MEQFIVIFRGLGDRDMMAWGPFPSKQIAEEFIVDRFTHPDGFVVVPLRGV